MGAHLAVNFSPVTDSQHQDQQSVVFNAAYNPTAAYAILPNFSKFGVFQGGPYAPRVFQISYPVAKEL